MTFNPWNIEAIFFVSAVAVGVMFVALSFLFAVAEWWGSRWPRKYYDYDDDDYIHFNDDNW